MQQLPQPQMDMSVEMELRLELARLDERQRNAAHQIDLLNGVAKEQALALASIDRKLTVISSSLEGRIGKAVWGYTVGGVGLIGGVLAILATRGGL